MDYDQVKGSLRAGRRLLMANDPLTSRERDFDIQSYVLSNEEFRDKQLAYMCQEMRKWPGCENLTDEQLYKKAYLGIKSWEEGKRGQYYYKFHSLFASNSQRALDWLEPLVNIEVWIP